MKNRARWLLAVMLAVVMTMSCMPMAAASGSKTAKREQSSNPWGINVDLSRVPAQVQASVANMMAQGQEPFERKTDAFLAEVVEEASGISYEAVKGSLGLELLSGAKGTVDTSRFNLGEEEFNRVMKEVLSEYFLTGMAYECDVENGIVTGIWFMPSSDAPSYRDMFTVSDLWSMYRMPLTSASLSASRVQNDPADEDGDSTKTLSYTVEYYKDGEKADTDTVTATVEADASDMMAVDASRINTTDKYEGYKFDHTDPEEIPEQVESGAAIKVYYVKAEAATKTLSYTVEYYKDGEKVDTDTVTATVEADASDMMAVDASRINTTDKYEGYKFDHTDPEEIPEQVESGAAIKVYYVKAEAATKTLSYTVEYYKDGEKADTDTVTATVEADASDMMAVDASRINTTDKYEGYKFDHTDPEEIPEQVESGAAIKVYYVKAEAATKTLSYTVEYYKDGEKADTDTVTATVEADASDMMAVDASRINTTDKYEGYKFDHTDPEEIPEQVESGAAIKVYYVKDEAETVTYTAKFNWVRDDQFVKATDKEIEQGASVDIGVGYPVALTLVYDAENKQVTYGPKTVIGFKLDSITLSADGYPTITLHEGDKGVTVQPVPMYSFYGYEFPTREMITEQFGMIDANTSAGDVASEIMYYQVKYDATGETYGGDVGDQSAPGRLDSTSMAEQIHWEQMLAFTGDFAQHFGAAGDFWTSKNTEQTPYGAFKTQLDSYPEDYMPDTIMDQYMELMTLAYMSYEQSYGSLLDQKIADCLAQLDKNMTPVQKYLVIHDWIANNAQFDMGVLVKTAAGTGNPEPAQMTAFGTLLSDAMGYDGCICLGYSATFAVLVQQAFPEIYQNKDGTWKTASEVGDDDIVDLVQIRFYADLAEMSVAGGDSGFGKADEMFGSVHYYNAVKVTQEDGTSAWYCIDSAYDDITTEVMDQCRVETKGNISHKYFMISPVNMLGMFEDSMDYIDCLYDGVVFRRTLNEAGTGWDTETDKYENEHVYWTKYETEDETAYDDDQYEATWFSGAVGEITHDENYWYYVTGPSFSYANMMNLMNQMEDQGIKLGDLIDQIAGENDSSDKDRLVRRPRDAADEPEETEETENEGGSTGGSGGMGGMDFSGMSSYDDPYDEILFHFGYGSVLPDEAVLDGEDEDAKKGPYYGEVVIDETYQDMYPDLVHSMGLYDGVIYFNLGNKIYTMTGADTEGKLTEADLTVAQLKEYNDVYAKTDGRDFTGMSFYAVSEADYTGDTENNVFHVFNRPIAAICIEDEVSYKDQVIFDENNNPVAQVKVRNAVTPTLTVSIGTNFSESNKGRKDDDGNYVYGPYDSYALEAVDYNPDYSKYTDDGSDPDVNDNEEFMWCANVVDTMPMEGMLEDKASGGKTDVTVDAWCGQDGYTEQRTVGYGLSDGTGKAVNESDLALNHHYIYNDLEECYICTHCNDSWHKLAEDDEDYEPLPEGATEGHYDYGEGETPVFVNIEWAKDFSTCTAQIKCAERHCDAAIYDTVSCTVKSETIHGSDDKDYRVFTATYMGNVVDKQYPDGELPYKPGDVNDDGEVNGKDVIRLTQYIAEWDVEINLAAADVNGDGTVNGKDLIRLTQYVAEWDVELT